MLVKKWTRNYHSKGDCESYENCYQCYDMYAQSEKLHVNLFTTGRACKGYFQAP